MRYIRYAFLALLAIVLIAVALANREVVTLQLLPAELSALLGLQERVSMPLFFVVVASIAAGLLIGFVWEWLREHKHRATAARREARIRELERELSKVKGQRDQGKDEVLVILDEKRAS
ncbi:lipopolysaccharide assembly protein LapA domain-containing protein [Litorisediminicola beolgyonensis]|uniref:Lipopolysaccharide assembly protein LapA domain-containing protein n=1 Tax=Litorisediminicola beolgyonensis TaxID=1173614 RepID=A0ABW3ZKC0_9RHOB